MEPKISHVLPYPAMSAVVASNVLGNVFMKLGSSGEHPSAQLFGLFGWHIIAGVSFFASAAVCYPVALKTLPLHVAQGLAALQFVGVITAAAFFFGEAIAAMKWLGIALICIGLALVTR